MRTGRWIRRAACRQRAAACAWVFQRGGADAAATEMSTTGGRLEFPTEPAPKWRMLLGKVGDHEVQEGEAFAVAVALMRNHAGECSARPEFAAT